jgi:hypothetical protein
MSNDFHWNDSAVAERGSRVNSYRSDSPTGVTSVAFWPEGEQATAANELRSLVNAFHVAVDAALPNIYGWKDHDSLHYTIQDLGRLRYDTHTSNWEVLHTEQIHHKEASIDACEMNLMEEAQNRADPCSHRTLCEFAAHGIVFVHVPKNAGTTVENIVLPFLGGSGWLNQSGWGPRSCHDTAEKAALRRPRVWKATTTFAITRHPLDRLVSLYEYTHSGGNGSPTDLAKFAWVSKLSFSDFVHTLSVARNTSMDDFMKIGDGFFAPQVHYFAPKRQLLVDLLLHSEDIENGWKDLQVLAPSLPDFPTPTSEHHMLRRTAHAPWRNYYNDSMVLSEAIAIYRADFAPAGASTTSPFVAYPFADRANL